MKKNIPLLALLLFTMAGCTVMPKTSGSTADSKPSSSTDGGTSGGDISTSEGSESDPSTGDDTSSDTDSSSGSQERSGVVEIKLAGFNDFHGHIEEEGEMVGLSKLSTYIKTKKSEGALVFNSGDSWQETFLASECKGTLISKVFRDSGVDVNTLGNHDFDWGTDAIRLNEQAEYLNEEFLGANIMDYPKEGTSWVKSDLGKEYKTFVLNEGTEQEVKVGVVGIIGKDQLTSITSKFVEDYVFYDHNEIIKDVSSKLRNEEHCDVVIASCHTPANQLDSSIFETDDNGYRKYVDAAFCAHDHSLYEDTVNDAPVLEAMSYGRYGSEITLNYNIDSGKVESSTHQNVYLSGLGLAEDAETSAEVAELKEACDAKGSTVYGSVDNYMSKANVGRWQAQCMAEKASDMGVDIDYAIVNNARAYLPEGEVNHYKMYETHPFVNDLYIVKVSMSDVYNEIYKYSNPFYRVTDQALVEGSGEMVTVLIYNYLLFHVSVNSDTYEKRYDYFSSLNDSGETPVLFAETDGTKINALDLTIADLQEKGSISANDYSENSWHNARSYLLEAQ